jgi:hypothetical protein
LKKLGEYLASVGKDRKKVEADADKKRKQKEAKKPIGGGGAKANSKFDMDDLDGYDVCRH